MADYVVEHNIDLSSSKIAIVDSGLDEFVDQYLDTSAIERFSVTATDLDLFKDQNLHGSFIAGIIAGEEGYGIAPKANLGIYELGDEENGGYAYHDIWIGAKKACDAGYNIINISQGYFYFESLNSNEQEDKAELLNELAENGCMIVKSAGNGSKRWRGDAIVDTSNPFLIVEASSAGGAYTRYSSDGEVRAPGDLFSLINPDYVPSQYVCNDSSVPAATNSGTSFSAPLVSGILANVRSVLETKHSEAFNRLSGSQKIELLNHIVLSSRKNNIVNGFSAVVTANSWDGKAINTTEPEKKSVFVSDFSFCDVSHATPLQCERDTLKEMMTCSSDVRKRLSACPETLSNDHLVQYLELLAKHSAVDILLSELTWLNNKNLLEGISDRLNRVPEVIKEVSSLYGNQSSWVGGGEMQVILDLSSVLGVNINLGDLVISQKFKDFMRHSEKHGAEFLLNSIANYLSHTPNPSQEIESAYTAWKNDVENSSGWALPTVLLHHYPISFVRLLDVVIQDSRFESEKSALIMTEAHILQDLGQSYALQLPNVYLTPQSNSNPRWEYNGLEEQRLQVITPKTLEGIISRQLPKIDASSRETSGILVMASLVAENNNIIEGGDLDETWRLLELLAHEYWYHPGHWYEGIASSTNPLLKAAFDNIQTYLIKNPTHFDAIQHKLTQLIHSATSPLFLLQFGSVYNLTTDTMSDLSRDYQFQLVSGEQRDSIFKKVLAIIDAQPRTVKFDYFSHIEWFIRRNSKVINNLKDDNWDFDDKNYREWQSKKLSRLDEYDISPLKILPENLDRNSVLSSIVVDLIDSYADKISNMESGYLITSDMILFLNDVKREDFCHQIDELNLDRAIKDLLFVISPEENPENHGNYSELRDTLSDFSCSEPISNASQPPSQKNTPMVEGFTHRLPL